MYVYFCRSCLCEWLAFFLSWLGSCEPCRVCGQTDEHWHLSRNLRISCNTDKDFIPRWTSLYCCELNIQREYSMLFQWLDFFSFYIFQCHQSVYRFILSVLSLQTFHMLLDIGIRMVTHDTICFVQRYFLGRAQTSYASRGTTVPASLQWLFRPKGHRFFVSSRWTCQGGDSMWASISDKSECNFVKKEPFHSFCLLHGIGQVKHKGYP